MYILGFVAVGAVEGYGLIFFTVALILLLQNPMLACRNINAYNTLYKNMYSWKADLELTI